MTKTKQKKPTTKQLKNDITVIIKEILELKGYVNEVVTPFITSTRNIFEQYLVYKGDVEKFTEHIQKEYSDEKGTNNKSPKKRKTKQAKGSRVTKNVSKNGKGSRPRSIQ